MAGLQSHTMNVTLTSKNQLNLDELELYELSTLAGVSMEPATFKIILDLLRMNVSPQAVLQMLKTMCAGRRKLLAGETNQHHDGETMAPPRQRPPQQKVRNPSGSSARRPAAKR